jgi:hypothetical protein
MKVASILAVLSAAALVQAAIVPDYYGIDSGGNIRLDIAIVNLGPVVTRGGAATAYDIYFDALVAGDKVAAVDFNIAGVYQNWSKLSTGGAPTPTYDLAYSRLERPERDSYAYVTHPTETNDFAYGQDTVGPYHDIEGNGMMTILTGLLLESMTQNLEYARVVVLDSQAAAFDMTGAVANGVGNVFTISLISMHSGDCNNDGDVNVGDLGIIAGNWQLVTFPGKTWTEGDLNGDDIVNVGDLGVVASHWGWHGSPAAAGAVPEPATMLLVAAGALGLLRRRRR